jgi:hypothetical protein
MVQVLKKIITGLELSRLVATKEKKKELLRIHSPRVQQSAHIELRHVISHQYPQYEPGMNEPE